MVFRASIERVMRSPPVTISISDTVSSVVKKMTLNDIGAIIVMDSGVMAGIVTERDLVEKVIEARKDPDETVASDVMSSPVVSIEMDRSVRDALKLMEDRRIRRLAVTRNGRLTGIVTERRLLYSLASVAEFL